MKRFAVAASVVLLLVGAPRATPAEPFAPRVVVHSTGHRNRFGHPSREVVARVRERGAISLDTATNGAVTVRLAPEGLAGLVKSRDAPVRYWRE